MIRKRWLTRLAILFAFLLAGGLLAFSFMNVQSTNNYMRAYVRYTELVTSMEQARLTVNEGSRTVGVYSLEQLGLKDQMEQAAQVCFGFSEAPKAENFAKLSLQEKRMAFQEINSGSVSVDESQLDIETVAADLKTMSRGSGDLFPAAAGAELDEEALAEVLMQTVAGWTATEKDMSPRTVNLADHALYTLPAEEENLPYSGLLTCAMEGMTIPVTLRDRTAELEVQSVVKVNESGVGTVSVAVLKQVIKAWAAECPSGWLPYELDSHDRGTVELDFLHVNYELDQELLMQQLTEQLKALDVTPIEAEYLCSREGKPYSIGETYIEVDIARQKMMLYEDGQLLVSTDVVTGYPWGRWTWPGIYRIQEKDTERQLIGEDYNVHVKYWLGYDGDYGIHDAQWRDEFGGELYESNGSHGCVNTPMEAMAAIFEKAEIGTPVIVHYVEE